MSSSKNNTQRKLFRPADFIVIVAAVFIVAAMLIRQYASPDERKTAVVTVRSEVIERISLPAENRMEIPIEGEYSLVIIIEGEQLFIEDAQCPDKICMHTGRISRTGASIICLPAQVSVHIETDTMADAVTY